MIRIVAAFGSESDGVCVIGRRHLFDRRPLIPSADRLELVHKQQQPDACARTRVERHTSSHTRRVGVDGIACSDIKQGGHMTEEERLLQKLQKLEALFAGAYAQGERDAAANAMDQIRSRLETFRQSDPPVEYTFTLQDAWSRKLMLALMRRYGIEPYRYRRQRHTTVVAKVPASFVDQTLWPEFQQFSEVLKTYLDAVTDRIIGQALGADTSDAPQRSDDARAALPAPTS